MHGHLIIITGVHNQQVDMAFVDQMAVVFNLVAKGYHGVDWVCHALRL